MVANPAHIDHVRKYLDEHLGPEVDLSDIVDRVSPDKVVEHRRSRSLAALAVQMYTRCDEQEAAVHVVDGFGDNGIDAVAWDLDDSHLYVIQSKWSETGKASLDRRTSHELVAGLKRITEHDHAKFNSRYQMHADMVAGIVDQPRFKVTLVAILMGTASIDSVAAEPLQEAASELNGVHHQCATVDFIRLSEIHNAISKGVTNAPVDLRLHLESSAQISEPHLAYYGSASAENIAEWYEDYGTRLFDRNIRSALGSTPVNAGIEKTLADEADKFWYFNNGITIICRNIERSGRARLRPSGPAHLLLEDASVVNGAQTVSSIHSAVRTNAEEAGTAVVWVRAIQYDGESFAKRITEANNTQNAIDQRDFASNDAIQQSLRQDFQTLDLSYVIKRGEPKPAADEGCDITDAAFALAAACPDTDVVVDAHRDPNLLWRDDSRGRYGLLFHRGLRAIRVWRLVRLNRAIDRQVKRRERSLEKRAGGFAKNLSHLVAHVVMRHLHDDIIDARNDAWEEHVLPLASPATDRALEHMINEADRLWGDYFPASLATNYERCSTLTKIAVEFLSSDRPAEKLPDDYRSDIKPPKKDNAVKIINHYQAIDDGDRVEFRAQTAEERRRMSAWLNEDPTRRFATWVVAKQNVLKWEHDNIIYSATGLANKMWTMATGKKPRSIQGTRYWYIGDQGSLVDIAALLRNDVED